MRGLAAVVFVSSLASGVAVFACSSTSPTSSPTPEPDAGAPVDAAPEAAALGPNPLPGCVQDPGPPPSEVNPASRVDPAGSAVDFTIEKALAGYPTTPGVLTALVTTELGTIRCELDEAKAPVTVANFVGLARGTRPYRAGGKWKVGRFYDGLLWHRVVRGFVVQGGCPFGNGTGSAGYDITVENQIEEPLGTLAMASGQVPSSSQFFIVTGTGPAAEYNVFGTCQTEVAVAISAVDAGPDEKPLVDVRMMRIDIARCPK